MSFGTTTFNGKDIEIRWAMSQELADWLTPPIWLYIQERASLVGANIIFSSLNSETVCEQLIEIGKLFEQRREALKGKEGGE